MKVTIRVKNKVYLDDQAKEYIESKIGNGRLLDFLAGLAQA